MEQILLIRDLGCRPIWTLTSCVTLTQSVALSEPWILICVNWRSFWILTVSALLTVASIDTVSHHYTCVPVPGAGKVWKEYFFQDDMSDCNCWPTPHPTLNHELKGRCRGFFTAGSPASCHTVLVE